MRTFVIIKAQFDGSKTYTYYKIDLAVKDENDKVTRVYDVVRNYAFNITVKSVSRKGATWAEVIDENVIADIYHGLGYYGKVSEYTYDARP